MRVVTIDEKSQHRALVISEMNCPDCHDEEILIDVHAAGVNRADLLQRAGKYPPPPGASPIMGLEVAGTVKAKGKNVRGYSVGDRVCALLSGGGYADAVAVPSEHAFVLPPSLSFEQGAGLPEAFITAFLNLFIEGGLESGERALVHGGSSGVGTAAIQLARKVGARVGCTVGNERKAEKCRALGAELAIRYKEEDFVAEAKMWSPEGVDVVLDCVGGDYLAKNLDLLALRGRIVIIASMRGAVGQIDIPMLMKKRARIIGSVLRSRGAEEKRDIIARFWKQFGQYLTSGELQVVVDSVYSLDQVEQAHARMESSEHIGKIILSMK